MNPAKQELRLEGIIEMPMPGGMTKVEVKLGGSQSVNVQTEEIPQHLRRLGSKVLVVFSQSNDSVRLPSGEETRFYEGIIVRDFQQNTELGWVTLTEDSL